jgi:CBS domain-containing protein
MQGLRARDLMTPDVVTVPPETPVIAVARLLADRGISAVPVTDAQGMLRGIVTEADLIRRLAGEEDSAPGWFAGLFADPATQADRYARTHGVTAEEIMTRPVITVSPDETASHIARLIEERNIRRAVMAAMKKEPWADTFYTLIEVKDGVVEFHGFQRSDSARRALRVLAENVPGVKQVVDNTQAMPMYLYAAA